jgi:SAM-dependent methyltransferase
MVILDLGGGSKPHPDAEIVIDLAHPLGAPRQDATAGRWRYFYGACAESIPDGHIDKIVSSHFIEHVPHGQPLINVMNEAWRVLKPGGAFELVMPIIGYTIAGRSAMPTFGWRPFADPTHVSFWWLPEAFHYFTGQIEPDAEYGLRRWAPLGTQVPESRELATPESVWCVRGGWEGFVRLIKPCS